MVAAGSTSAAASGSPVEMGDLTPLQGRGRSRIRDPQVVTNHPAVSLAAAHGVPSELSDEDIVVIRRPVTRTIPQSYLPDPPGTHLVTCSPATSMRSTGFPDGERQG